MRQRTELVNAVRASLFEFGPVSPKGPRHLRRVAEIVADGETALPGPVRDVCRDMLEKIDRKTTQIAEAPKRLEALGRRQDTARRLQGVPGIGPVAGAAIETFAPPMETFRRGGTSPPDWASCPLRYRPGASSVWAAPRRWGSATSTAADRRRDVGDQLGVARARTDERVARAHAGAQVAHARRGGAGQQDGGDGLGDVGEARGLPLPGGRARVSAQHA